VSRRKHPGYLDLYRQTLVSNTACLVDYLQKLIYLYERKGTYLSTILMDVDNLKYVNRKKGYGFGNLLLLKVAEVIEKSIRKSDVAGKYKGSSFLIILPDADKEGAFKVANRIRENLLYLELEGFNIKLTQSIYSFIPCCSRAEDILNLLEKKSTDAKLDGGDRIVFVEEEIEQRPINHEMLLNAIENQSVEPAFQPIYDIVKGDVEGYEVLMRLIMEDGTALPAISFIEDLLKTSFITMFEEIVINKALSKVRDLNLGGRIYINFPHNFVSFVAKGKLKIYDFYKEVLSHGIEPSRIMVEISEGKTVGSTEDLIQLAKEIRSYGFGLAVDDFGVEYSSIERLIKTSPDLVKLDGFFLKEAKSMLKWVVMGLKKLGYKVLVEQVETKEDLEYIRGLKVELAQGFYLGEPKVL
jgi:diguanylate cyclase (GGDEF)-like protein